jgi:hypothetical protein
LLDTNEKKELKMTKKAFRQMRHPWKQIGKLWYWRKSDGSKTGPVITMYEFQPDEGIKVSRISNLADDHRHGAFCRLYQDYRTDTGEAVVGIEIPNKTR